MVSPRPASTLLNPSRRLSHLISNKDNKDDQFADAASDSVDGLAISYDLSRAASSYHADLGTEPIGWGKVRLEFQISRLLFECLMTIFWGAW